MRYRKEQNHLAETVGNVQEVVELDERSRSSASSARHNDDVGADGIEKKRKTGGHRYSIVAGANDSGSPAKGAGNSNIEANLMKNQQKEITTGKQRHQERRHNAKTTGTSRTI